jgi:hypothetical protein
VIHLRGLDGIEQAQGLPQGARDLLAMHVRTLPPGESNHYIVNKQLADEWIRTHPVPPSAKPRSSDSHAGCHSFSWHCAGEAAQHAAAEGSRQAEELRRKSTEDWRRAAKEVAHQWKMAESCFADHTLQVSDIPVQFSIAPEFPLSFEQHGKRPLGRESGSASGSVKGTLAVGVPVAADFRARVELFYLPCLPFAVRPKSLGANGTMTVGSRLTASASATGRFSTLFTIPPTGGPLIPVEVIPIVIAGVPVAEVDVSVYLDGTVAVEGEGALDGHFKLDAPHRTAFDFECSGRGCRLRSHNIPVPTVTSEDVRVKGRIQVKPAIYAALQLDFDYDALSARAGPQPYLLAELAGCTYASAIESPGAVSTAQEWHALTADLDWAIELRAEALVATRRMGNPLLVQLMKPEHLWFKDLVASGSTALALGVDGLRQVPVGQPAAYRLKTRPCYPYTDAVEYRLSWTGRAVPTPVSGCTWQSGHGTCRSDPRHEATIHLSWPSAGQYQLTVAPVKDAHGRVFSPNPTQVDVDVQAGGSSGSPVTP